MPYARHERRGVTVVSPDQRLDLRISALRESVETFATTLPEEEGSNAQTAVMLERANRFYGWLVGATRLILRVGPAVGEDSDTNWPKHPASEGEIVQINTGQKFSVAIDTRDAAGYPTDAVVEWSIADETVATVVLDAGDDQKGWVISGAPGSTVLTVRVTDVEPALEATLAVDVVPAGTATVQINAGPAVPEEDPQPEPLVLTVVEDTSDANRQTVSVTVDNKGEGPVTVDFGDGNPGVANPGDGATASLNTYAAAGDYTVVATDDDNATRGASQLVTVPFAAV
jgi:hypothetical protein